MGIYNLETQVGEYHADKEAKIQQEELIKQQLELVAQRKAAEQATKEPIKKESAPVVK